MHRDMEQKWNNFGETSPGKYCKIDFHDMISAQYGRAPFVSLTAEMH